MARFESEGTWFERTKPHPCNCCGGPSSPERKHMPRCDHCWQRCRLGGPHQTRWFVSIDPGYAERGAVGYVSHAGGAFEYKPKLSDYARNALLDHMHAGLFNLPTPYERKNTPMKCTINEATIDDTTTITTPNGERVTLAQAARCFDDAREATRGFSPGTPAPGRSCGELLELRKCRIQELEGQRVALQAERDDARREARQAKAEAEESAKAAERARAEVRTTAQLQSLRERFATLCTIQRGYHMRGVLGPDAMRTLQSYHSEVSGVVYGADLRAAKPATPALTPDTPVTLGMLRDLDARGRDLSIAHGYKSGHVPTALRLSIAEALRGR